ncbi:hypothetical protein HG535_0H00200 [Zygotorulaspora mrakii]|uniref:Uncharacterized protein n=1 Tax=Zygotorulaspora mrakii TaxID=42260 RepID=A0A7H9B7P8_ZYGMR|nr:uncharacterized protein HG535_0H00200 [Zygotorulaspora mrakii]QLG74695.1 hypothetical protein HG535_0H00200 [Zygotorulaspora mrakii]
MTENITARDRECISNSVAMDPSDLLEFLLHDDVQDFEIASKAPDIRLLSNDEVYLTAEKEIFPREQRKSMHPLDAKDELCNDLDDLILRLPSRQLSQPSKKGNKNAIPGKTEKMETRNAGQPGERNTDFKKKTRLPNSREKNRKKQSNDHETYVDRGIKKKELMNHESRTERMRQKESNDIGAVGVQNNEKRHTKKKRSKKRSAEVIKTDEKDRAGNSKKEGGSNSNRSSRKSVLKNDKTSEKKQKQIQ